MLQVRLWSVARTADGDLMGLSCSNEHAICLTCARRLVFESQLSPTRIKYDCPVCRAGCVVDTGHINAMFKGFAANVLRTLGGALVLVGYDEIKRIIGA